MLNDFTGADQVYIACGYTDLRKGIRQSDEQTGKGTFESERMVAGKDATPSVTIRKPAKPSSRMCWEKRRQKSKKS